ncbi:redoxin domain-containing protein [Candidatus Dojkabacteria bacterium]|nr:redoxin domain-containing protein [Candidatus Dojkabacteria bacterium]
MLKVGEKIPNLKAAAYHKDKIIDVNFKDYEGKWLILLFYPADFTFVCPTELGDAADSYKKFQAQDAEILSISTDTVFVHKAWHDNSETISKIKYPMLADPNGNISKSFGTYDENGGHSIRATFIIDPDQNIIACEMHDNSIGRNIDEIFRKLQAAIFVRKNKGALVCPARWKPGDKSLKPGVDLVGAI